MRLLVTGGAGFIGSHLCRHLLETGRVESVRVLDDLSTGSASNLDDLNVELVEGTVLDLDALQAGVRSVDAVVHLAARVSVAAGGADPVSMHRVNATGTLNVLEAARLAGVGQVVLASSAAVYGDDGPTAVPETSPPLPANVYGASKLAAEAYGAAYAVEHGLGTLALRFFNVYGPRQTATSSYAAVIPAFVSAALDGNVVTVNGDGMQTRDFVHVDQVCDLITDAVLRGVCRRGPVNVASGASTSLLSLLRTLEEITGRPVARRFVPARAGDVRHSAADVTLLRTLFPTVPSRSLADGLDDTVRWARTHECAASVVLDD